MSEGFWPIIRFCWSRDGLTREEVDGLCRQAIEEGAPNYGFILTTAGAAYNPHASVNLIKNLIQMIKSGRKYGKYRRERLLILMQKKLKIRRLGKKDKEIFWEYFQALSEKTKDLFRPHPFDEKTAEKLCHENNPNTIRFITVKKVNGEERVIGYTFLAKLNENFPELGICIRDDYQGKGLAKILMEHLIKIAKSLGKKGLTLGVFKDNKKAFKLYTKLRFEIDRATYLMKLKF